MLRLPKHRTYAMVAILSILAGATSCTTREKSASGEMIAHQQRNKPKAEAFSVSSADKEVRVSPNDPAESHPKPLEQRPLEGMAENKPATNTDTSQSLRSEAGGSNSSTDTAIGGKKRRLSHILADIEVLSKDILHSNQRPYTFQCLLLGRDALKEHLAILTTIRPVGKGLFYVEATLQAAYGALRVLFDFVPGHGFPSPELSAKWR
ncbi:MAG: hypothetical protein KDB07_13795, partial [Planctomycetes bacterium]|nr:hypothetical protein [Planctomycetota bacterium]